MIVPKSDFTALTGIADLKLGRVLDGVSPYVQATGYFNFLDKADLPGALGRFRPGQEHVVGRFGIGMDMDLVGGKLSLTTGVFVGRDGFQGVDGGFKFVKTF